MNTEFHVTAGSYFVDKGLVSEAEGAVESDKVRAGMKYPARLPVVSLRPTSYYLSPPDIASEVATPQCLRGK